MSLTDLHKGTHNCAAAIRESGAGISPSTPLPSFPAAPAVPFAPVSPRAARSRSTPRRPPSTSSHPLRFAEGGDGARALSQCAAIIFPHEWAAVSVVPGLVLRCSCCIFYPSPSAAYLPGDLSHRLSLLLRRFSDTFERKGPPLVGREYFSLI